MEDAEFDGLLRRGRTLTVYDPVMGPWIGGDIVALWNVVGELADRLGYVPEPPKPRVFDEQEERKRMAELRSTIEGLKNGTA